MKTKFAPVKKLTGNCGLTGYTSLQGKSSIDWNKNAFPSMEMTGHSWDLGLAALKNK
jgi:hypothetical protein